MPHLFLFLGVAFTLIGTIWLNAESSRTQETLRNDIIKKSEKITELATNNAGLITGGDSYPEILPIRSHDNSWEFMVLNQGKYPLYDLVLLLRVPEDIAPLFNESFIDIEKLKSMDHYVRVGTLGVTHGVKVFGYKTPEGRRKNTFRFEFTARNGTFTQLLYNYDGMFATHLSGFGKVLKREANNNFPKVELPPNLKDLIP